MTKKLYDEEIDSQLTENAEDRTAQVLRVLSASVPVAGPFLAELINEVIPNLRMERLNRYVTSLSKCLREMEGSFDLLSQHLTVSQVALFEEGARAASRATEQVTIERIARRRATHRNRHSTAAAP